MNEIDQLMHRICGECSVSTGDYTVCQAKSKCLVYSLYTLKRKNLSKGDKKRLDRHDWQEPPIPPPEMI